MREWWAALAARDTARLAALSADDYEQSTGEGRNEDLGFLLATALDTRASIERWSVEDIRFQHAATHAVATYRWRVTRRLANRTTRTDERGTARDSLVQREGRWWVRAHRTSPQRD